MEGTVLEAIDEVVRTAPHRPAVRAGDGELTYGELDTAADRLAAAVHAADPGCRCPVGGVLLRPSVGVVVAQLALARSGRAVVGLDRDAPPTRLSEVVAQLGTHLGPVVIVTEPALRPLVPDGAVAVDLGDGPPPADWARPSIGPADLLNVAFTSGSTGVPRASMRSHRAQRWVLEQARHGPGPFRRALVFDHSVGYHRQELWCGLGLGDSLHLFDARAVGPAPPVRGGGDREPLRLVGDGHHHP
jgi:acyl-CoA synthetase (AMP-forming)/AMP-acid ligase II